MTQPGGAYIDPTRIRIHRNPSRNLCVEIGGRGSWEKVVVRLAFPFSDPRRHVVLSTADEEEIGVIADCAELEPESRRVLEEALEKRYHIPVIRRIVHAEDEREATRWAVETDRGPRTFAVQDRHNFTRVRGRRLIITDVDGNRFCIPDVARLDRESQKFLDLYS